MGMELPPDMPAEIMEELMAEFMDEMIAEEMPIPLSTGSNTEWTAYNSSTDQEYILSGSEGLIEEEFSRYPNPRTRLNPLQNRQLPHSASAKRRRRRTQV